jgi:hypothetical protein
MRFARHPQAAFRLRHWKGRSWGAYWKLPVVWGVRWKQLSKRTGSLHVLEPLVNAYAALGDERAFGLIHESINRHIAGL